MKWNTVLIVVLASGLSVTGVTGRITSPPLNTVAEVGGQAIFICTSDLGVQNWVFSTTREEYDTSTGQIIVLNCMVQPGFITHYEVDRPGGSNNKCNLIVKAATTQQAGVYTCSDIAPGQSAILTVIDRDASIAVNSQPESVEGDRVTMSCAVRYKTSTVSSKTPTIQPVLSWTDSDGNTVTGSPSTTTNSVTSSISVTAERQDIRPYTCRISFEVKWPSPSSGLPFTTNTPSSLSNPPTTSTISVLYGPSKPSITSQVPVCPGKTVKIACHATANPPATYSWIGPDSRSYSGATTDPVMNGTYSCTAANIIRGSIRSDTSESTLNLSSDTSESCEDPSESVVKAAIVLGTLLAVSLAVNIVLIVFIIRGRSSLKNGMKTENTSNIGHQNNEQHNRINTEETSFPAVYQELSPGKQQPTIYAQLTN